jgi:phospholipid-transporting ATPase
LGGTAYIQTVSLDGETNLKVRKAHPETTKIKNEEEILNFQGRIECEQPNESIYTFGGVLYVGDSTISKPISKDQILLRGSKLKNTDFIYGIVIFAGVETKLMKNSTKPPHKISNMERLTNYCVFSMFVIQLSISFLCGICYTIFSEVLKDKLWYVYLGRTDNGADYFFKGLKIF